MTLREYCVGAGMTDQITDEQAQKGYYVFGLSGEASETLEKMFNKEEERQVLLEAADVCWYAIRLWFKLKGLSGIPDTDVDSLTTSVKEDFSALDAAIAISVVAGRVSECHKKVIRDRNGVYTQEDVESICKNCNIIIMAVSHMGSKFDYKLSEILEMNLAKLASRQARNMIHGSGDNR